MRFFTNLLFFSVFLLLIQNCKTPQNKIPYVYVNFTIDLDQPEFFELNSIGNYVYVTGGVSGIVIYRDSRDVFFAYERACPYDPECGRVEVVDSNYTLIDTCCGSQFSLTMDGAVLKGPAEMPLRQYHTLYYENTNQLRVYSD